MAYTWVAFCCWRVCSLHFWGSLVVLCSYPLSFRYLMLFPNPSIFCCCAGDLGGWSYWSSWYGSRAGRGRACGCDAALRGAHFRRFRNRRERAVQLPYSGLHPGSGKAVPVGCLVRIPHPQDWTLSTTAAAHCGQTSREEPVGAATAAGRESENEKWIWSDRLTPACLPSHPHLPGLRPLT